MGTPLSCRLGRHRWELERRQLDVDEPPRIVQVCSRCQRISLGQGSRFEHTDLPDDPNGTGQSSGFAGGAPF
ncbi:MAG TPA: hypothetical protein VFU98_16240 [Microlunatus sp.]|nr:hypothetical protein [Microlunatus sp.]